MATVAGLAVLTAVSVLVARSEVPDRQITASVSVETADPTPVTIVAPAVQTATPPVAPRARAVPTDVGAVTTTAITALRKHPYLDAAAIGWPGPGVLMPVFEKFRSYYKVMTPHEFVGWVHESKVKTHKKAGARPVALMGATVVIDPGHGGHLPGAKGPGGFLEKDANLAISQLLAPKLAGARVFVTRGTGHAGLGYRAQLANRLGAHAFVSVHNNALPDVLSNTPGTEVYHQMKSQDSKRLAGLLYEEIVHALKPFKIKWGRDPFAGAKYRKSHQHGGDYYAVLRRSLVPAVIVEGMFISNGPEEQLLRQGTVREVVAQALARGIKRYFSTSDPGSGFQDPYAKPTPKCPIPGCFEHRK